MGSIGIRPADNHHFLWFHLDQLLATENIYRHSQFRPPLLPVELQPGLLDLTDIGFEIVVAVIRIPGIKEVEIRPKYFNLWINRERDWRTILPRTIGIIREATKDPRARVRPEPPYDSRVAEWHIPLLEEFFGYRR